MKNFLCVLLALLMLCGTVVLFSSCGGEQDGNVMLSGELVELDLSGYTAIFSEELSKTKGTRLLADEFLGRLHAVTGKTLPRYTDSTVPASKEGFEILFGLTDRKESKDAQKKIEGDGFCIRVTDNKIAITGTSNLYLVMAMEYFAQKYLTENTKKTITVHESALAENMETLVVDEKEEKGISIIYEDGIKTDPNKDDLPHAMASLFHTTTGDNLFTSKKAKTNLLFLQSDKEEVKTDVRVFVGDMKNDLVQSCRAELGATEYGFFVRKDGVVLTSPNGEALLAGGEIANKLLQDAIEKTDEGNTMKLPVGLTVKGHVNKNWVMDFPKPEGEGITLYNTMDAQNDSLQYYYVGEGVSADSYRAYCKQLTDAGYTVLTENEIEGSIFHTLVDPTNTFSLYVAYNAYKYAGNYGYADNTYNAQYQKCIRVVSSPLSAVNLPDEGLLTPNPKYTRVTNSSITALELYKESVGMGYIITLEDGRLIVFDGGMATGTASADLWNLLKATNERITGLPTSTENPVRIAAWVLTHSHTDHFHNFLTVLTAHPAEIRMDYILGNFPSPTSDYSARNEDAMDMGKQGKFERYVNLVPGGFKFVKVHAGQKFWLANVEIEILTTYEDLNPARIYTANDTNTVTRFTMHNTNEAGERVGEPTTIVWLGDANALQSRHMSAMFGGYLESDMVQLAHHGNTGCEKDLYTLINAKVLWFPVDYWRVERFVFETKHPTLRDINLHALTLPRMQYVFVSGNQNKADGSNPCDYNLCLPFSAETGMPDYDGIYEGITGNPLTYDDISAYENVNRFVDAKNK